MEPFTVPDSVLGPRDVVVVEGPDAMSYLQSQLSQDVRDLGVQGSTWTLVLEPTGKITSLARVRRTGAERFELDTDAGHGEELLARLDRFKIRVKATTSLIKASVDAPHRNESERIELGWPAMGHELVDPAGHRPHPHRGQLHQGLLSRAGVGRADGQPWRRGSPDVAPARRPGGIGAGRPGA
jgi:hypothetical protein